MRVIKRGTATGHVMQEIALAGEEGADASELLCIYLAYSKETSIEAARPKLTLMLRRHELAGNLERLGRREHRGRPIIWRMTEQGKGAFRGQP